MSHNPSDTINERSDAQLTLVEQSLTSDMLKYVNGLTDDNAPEWKQGASRMAIDRILHALLQVARAHRSESLRDEQVARYADVLQRFRRYRDDLTNAGVEVDELVDTHMSELAESGS